VAEVDARIRAKSLASAPTVEDAAALFANLPALWDEAGPQERRRLVAPLIERVYVDLESKRLGGFAPSSAFRSLRKRAVRRSDSEAVILSPDEPESLESVGWWRRGRISLRLADGREVLIRHPARRVIGLMVAWRVAA
jgi:hypothetical protein